MDNTAHYCGGNDELWPEDGTDPQGSRTSGSQEKKKKKGSFFLSRFLSVQLWGLFSFLLLSFTLYIRSQGFAALLLLQALPGALWQDQGSVTLGVAMSMAGSRRNLVVVL